MTGLELKTGRRSWKLSQAELAKRLRVNPRTIARWETKERIPETIRLALMELNVELKDEYTRERETKGQETQPWS